MDGYPWTDNPWTDDSVLHPNCCIYCMTGCSCGFQFSFSIDFVYLVNFECSFNYENLEVFTADLRFHHHWDGH